VPPDGFLILRAVSGPVLAFESFLLGLGCPSGCSSYSKKAGSPRAVGERPGTLYPIMIMVIMACALRDVAKDFW